MDDARKKLIKEGLVELSRILHERCKTVFEDSDNPIEKIMTDVLYQRANELGPFKFLMVMTDAMQDELNIKLAQVQKQAQTQQQERGHYDA